MIFKCYHSLERGLRICIIGKLWILKFMNGSLKVFWFIRNFDNTFVVFFKVRCIPFNRNLYICLKILKQMFYHFIYLTRCIFNFFSLFYQFPSNYIDHSKNFKRLTEGNERLVNISCSGLQHKLSSNMNDINK